MVGPREPQGEMKTVNDLFKQLENGDWNQKIEASDFLVTRSSSRVISSLIALLESKDGDVRNAAALALREIGDNSAVAPLFQAIKNPAHKRDNSTLVYALECLDCSRFFLEIFALTLSPYWDVHISAMTILHEQKFHIKDADIRRATAMLKKTKSQVQDYETLEAYLKSLRHDEGDEGDRKKVDKKDSHHYGSYEAQPKRIKVRKKD